ncbi:MAG: DUF4388 domain-containing protein [Cyanobacteria bacterium P01_F01_bin.86]
MAITGYLSEYSLPELLHLLEVDTRTGQLKLQPKDHCERAKVPTYCIWLKQGRIISAFNRNLGGHNLLRLMCQRQLLEAGTAQRLLRRSPVEQPFGLYLKQREILTAKQLQRLFAIQVMHQIRALFALEDARFQFRDDPELPYSEMTGISIRATEVILPGLRALKNWAIIKNSLPDAMSGLLRYATQPTMRLKSTEQQVWHLANGKISLQAIAQQLQWPLLDVQQIAFCLINAGLLEEVPIETRVPVTSLVAASPGELASTPQSEAKVSQTFIAKLEQYLRI